MNRWFRIGLIAALLAALVVITANGGLGSQDKVLQDARFGLSGLAPSGQTVLVEIDSKSLAEVGLWPWPRGLHARLLDRLVDMGAAEIGFDIDFSSASLPDQDALFAAALERAGGYAWLGAFQQQTQDGVALSTPLPVFLEQADAASVNVLLDEQGLARHFLAQLKQGDLVIPALASALSGRVVEGTDEVGIDYGIDANAFARYSFVDVIEGRVDPDAFRDRNVIIGATAVELRDFFQTPRFGTMPGPIVQAVAAETLIQGRELRDLGYLPSAVALAAGALLLALLGRWVSIWVLGATVLGLMAAWEAVAIVAYLQSAYMIDTALLHVGLPILFAVELASEVSSQVRQRRVAQQRLAYLATHDEKTGTLSRTGLLEAMPLMGPHGTVIVLKVLRLDQVRGTLGPEISDAVLARVGSQLAGLRPTLLAYVAQDVFALCFSKILDDESVSAACTDMDTLISGMQRVAGHGVMMDILLAEAAGANIGDTLLRNAEIALLHGEANRQDRTRFEPAQSEAIYLRRQTDIELREAIGKGQLSLVYQPQIDLRSRAIVGAEALMRWHHPERGAVSPASFIPLAEETGYIVDLGRWALLTACRECAGWPRHVRVAVNVSPAQLRLSDILMDVSAALTETGLPPGRLDVEITEGALVDNLDVARTTMTALSRMGVGLSLDDFGTGYSALSYLTTLPFDKIKIDQSFIRRLGEQGDNALLQTIIELCQRLEKVAVAEGIETEAQIARLSAWGCDIGQGYLLGKPLSASVLYSTFGWSGSS